MPLRSGVRFGPYEVGAQIGAGGMGEVYRATDTNLKRQVALKVLPASVSIDPDRLARFRREAEVLAALNHPHIAQIFGLEPSEGTFALVMELVEGATLADRIARGALPLDEALPIAKQIAEALEAAHHAGIIHRDLKPANIALDKDGRVKVLDFGLAKAIETLPGAVDAANSPTITSPAMLSTPGVILGTAAYMSPEQAKGRLADKRSDVWAFGCVLYEMITGQRAFGAETVNESLAAVIAREPDFRPLPATTPASVRRLIRRCLQKDPTNRLHDIADARIEIDDALHAPPDDTRSPGPAKSRMPIAVAIVTVAVLTLAALAVWGRFLPARRDGPSAPATEFGITFPNNYVPANGVVISPDGRWIAANVFSNNASVWVHSLDVDGSQPRPLAGGENAGYAFWSPDSTRLAFFQRGQIVTMNPAGGSRTIVAKLGEGEVPGGAFGGSWSRDNVMLLAVGGKLLRVPAVSGSVPVDVAIRGVNGRLTGPKFLPDGRHFLVCADSRDGGSIYLASLDDDRAFALGPSVCPGGFAPPNYVLYLRGGSIVAQRLDLRRFVLDGDPQPIASNVTRGSLGPWPVLTLSASDTGALAFPAPRGGSSLGRLMWFDREGRNTGTIESPSADVEYLNPAISPNRALVAANRLDPETGAFHIWLIDGARDNAASRLTTDAAPDFDPIWSPDGNEIIYVSDRDGRRRLYRQRIAGGPAVEVLDASRFSDPIPSDVSPDGRILFSDLQRSIWEFRPGDAAPTQLGSPGSYGPHLSPDGKWLAYARSQGGAFEIYVERFPAGSPKKKISAGSHPRWTSSGKEVVYWTPPGGIVSTGVELSDGDIRVGQTRTLVSEPVQNLIDARTAYDITRDGQKILMRQRAGPPSPGVRVIVNWTARLK